MTINYINITTLEKWLAENLKNYSNKNLSHILEDIGHSYAESGDPELRLYSNDTITGQPATYKYECVTKHDMATGELLSIDFIF